MYLFSVVCLIVTDLGCELSGEYDNGYGDETDIRPESAVISARDLPENIDIESMNTASQRPVGPTCL
ncbi:hypothetical protein QUF72_21570 [Desulfobacterales bacterium HSG2]|nr:hypothetical protein [Desulfobacterales bacterium HSG2]